MSDNQEIVNPNNSGWDGLEASFDDPSLVSVIAHFVANHSISGVIAVGTLAVMGLTIWQQSAGWATANCVVEVSFGTFAMLFTGKQYGQNKEQTSSDESGDASASPSEARNIE